jgi:hypothetical protein
MVARARLRGTGPEQDACVVNVSSRGLAATAEEPPQRGEIVEIEIGGNRLIGQVKWSDMRRFGIVLRERISVVSLLSGDSDGITLKRKEAARKQKARRSADNSNVARRLEFAVFLAAGAAATFIAADFAGSALQSLDSAKVALRGNEKAKAESPLP